VEFLVNMEVQLPADLPAQEKERLTRAEADRAAELARCGALVRLWRVPGRRANWGLWRAADATELHDALASLPMFPHLAIQVNALAAHPNDPT